METYIGRNQEGMGESLPPILEGHSTIVTAVVVIKQ